MSDLYGGSSSSMGMRSPQYDMYGGAAGSKGGPSAAKMAMLMGYNHLNTIEEEKHET
jgi:hypothetical protein